MDKIKEDIDKTIYNENSLSLLNIKDLRDMGRKIGVPSPTTKTKQELVEYILKIVYGEIEAPARSVYGRPNVREFDMGKYVKKIQKNSVINPESFKFVLNGAGFESTLSSPTSNYDVGELIEQRVFVETEEGLFLRVHAFLESEDDLKVSKELAKRFKLENLDMVEIVSNHETFKIISVNGVKIETKINGFEINGKKVKGGSSHIFHFSTKEKRKEEIKKLEETCKQNKLKLIAFSSETDFSDSTESVSFKESEKGSMLYKKFMYFISLCEKISIDGEEFMMLVDGVEMIDEAIDSFEFDVSERIKKHLQETISKIVSFGNVAVSFKLEKEITY